MQIVDFFPHAIYFLEEFKEEEMFSSLDNKFHICGKERRFLCTASLFIHVTYPCCLKA